MQNKPFAIILYSLDSYNPEAINDSRIFCAEELNLLDGHLINKVDPLILKRSICGYTCYIVDPSNKSINLYRQKFNPAKQVTIINPEKKKDDTRLVNHNPFGLPTTAPSTLQFVAQTIIGDANSAESPSTGVFEAGTGWFTEQQQTT